MAGAARSITRTEGAEAQSPPRARWLALWTLSRVRDPSTSLLLSQVVVATAAMVANVLAARGLAPSGRGEIALLLQLSYVCTVGVLLGSDRSFVLTYHGRPPADAVRGYVGLLWRPALVLLGSAVVLALGSVPESAAWRWSAVLVVLFAVINAFVRAVKQTAIAARRPRQFLVNTVVSQVLLVLLLLVLFLRDVDQPRMWMSAYVVSAAVPTAVYFLRRAGNGQRHGTTMDGPGQRSARRTVRREGLALLPAALSNMAMLRVDRIMLAGLASTAALGLYATVATLTEMLVWPLAAYADSRVGAWRAAHDRGSFHPRRLLAGAAAFAVAGGFALGVVAYVGVEPLFGQRYAPAKDLIPPLILAAAVYAVARVSIATLVARRRRAFVSVAEAAGLVISLLAYLLLIPTYGALGAAWGSLAGYSACLVATLVALGRASRREAAA